MIPVQDKRHWLDRKNEYSIEYLYTLYDMINRILSNPLVRTDFSIVIVAEYLRYYDDYAILIIDVLDTLLCYLSN